MSISTAADESGLGKLISREDDPGRVDYPGDIAEYRKEDVQEELHAESDLQEYSQRRYEEGEYQP